MAYLQSFVVMALVVVGLTGIAYHLFRDGGWLESVLGNFFDYTMRYPLILIFVILVGTGLTMWWRADYTRGHQRQAPTVVLYIIMAFGAWFVGRIALYGTL